MKEIDLLKQYPQIERDTEARARTKTEEQKSIALKFGWEYFDKKGICYNGYFYDGRWIPIVQRFIEYFDIKDGMKILDVGCAKGYMLYDFKNALPNLELHGIDISEYALNCSPNEIRDSLRFGNAKDLSMFDDDYFDVVFAINSIHSFKTIDETALAVSEIQRVSKGKSYIIVDSYSNEKEKKRMEEWQIAGHIVLSETQWKEIFKNVSYSGDYYWFKP
jgi:SAM-dependent methyltransferase